MRFFHRRGRSQSVDRNAKKKNSRQYVQPPPGYRSDKRSAAAADNDSVGSELPTLDQFEIAVPSKSFANSETGEIEQLEAEAREDDVMDDRSNTDISSITSVSYRAGYYYLRNIKKKQPERRARHSCLPSCCCSLCTPCTCSWLSCCCCWEAKNELAATAAPATHTKMLGHPPSREKLRKSHSPGRRGMVPPGVPAGRVHPVYGVQQRDPVAHRTTPTSSRRYTMPASGRREQVVVDPLMAPTLVAGDDGKVYPVLQPNHSLFDELSEEEDYGGHRARQKQQHNQKRSSKNSKSKSAWLGGRGRTGYGGPQHDYATRGKSGRSSSRGRRRRVDRYL